MVLTYNVIKITSTSTISTNIDTVFVNPQDPTVNVSLPAISGDGQRYLIKRVDSSDTNNVFILPNGSDTIGGSSTQAISPGQVIEIVSTGTNWEYVLNISL